MAEYPEERTTKRMTDQSNIESVMSLAYDLLQSENYDEAEEAFRRAAKTVPSWSVPWYELGLLCKYQSRWPESLEFNRQAAELDPADEAAWWNMGIAATAIADWESARRAWRSCGISIPEGPGPPNENYGIVPIRLSPGDVGEVVWARRIDPARARILNVPLPTTTYQWGDLVLHDGASAGYRVLEGREVPVFNVLEVLEPSGLAKFVLELASSSGAAVTKLEQIAEERGGAAENWGASTNILCRECSLGTAHVHSAGESRPAHPHCGVAALDDQHADEIINAWIAAVPDSDVVRWYRVAVA